MRAWVQSPRTIISPTKNRSGRRSSGTKKKKMMMMGIKFANSTNKLPGIGLNRGFLKEGLRVEVPRTKMRRFTESEVGFKQRCPPKTYTPCAAKQFLKRVHLRNLNGGIPGGGDECGVVRDSSDLGTPSAPPIFESGSDEKGFEAESELRESNVVESWTCPSMEAGGYGESVEGGAELGTSSMKASEVDERVYNTHKHRWRNRNKNFVYASQPIVPYLLL